MAIADSIKTQESDEAVLSVAEELFDDQHAFEEDALPQDYKPLRITNIVSISFLATEPDDVLPLDSLCIALQGKFGKKVFPAVVSRVRELKVTLCYFSTRKVVCTGSKTREESEAAHCMAGYQASKHLNRHYHSTQMRITNIVLACSIGFDLNMKDIDQKYSNRGWTWRPGVFNGMKIPTLIRPSGFDEEYKIAFIVFSNGRINVTGARHEDHIPLIQHKMLRMFTPFKATKT